MGRNGYVVDMDRDVPDGSLIKLAVGDTAVDLLETAKKFSLPRGSVVAVVEGDVRMTEDGSDPVASGTTNGMPFYDGAVLTPNWQRANAMKLIAYTVGTPATVWVQKMQR